MNLSDHDLLLLLDQNLYRHFHLLVLAYPGRLFTFAKRLTNSAQEAEDIVQEAFVSAYVSLENYSSQRILDLKLQAWLYRVTFNVYTHATRRSRLQLISLEPLTATSDNQVLELADSEEEQPEFLFESQERLQELEAQVALLPERYRIAITLYYFEQLSSLEIAELLEQPVGTVKSNISRGIRLLRTRLNTVRCSQKEQWL